MHFTRKRLFLTMLILCCLYCMTACGVQPTSNGAATPGNDTNTTATMVTTPQVLPTQTDCPTTGTARAAVMPPLGTGKHQGFVYSFTNDTSITFRKYDSVTKSKIDLLTLPFSPSSVTVQAWRTASISADGQWMVFITQKDTNMAIQMLRLDGKEQQTLYCSANIHTISLSPNQKYLAFGEVDSDTEALYTIDLSSGTIHKTLSIVTDKAGVPVYEPIKWASNTSLYVIKTPTSGIGGADPWGLRFRWGLFLVKDVTKSISDQASNLQTITLNGKEQPSEKQDFDMQGNQKVFFNKFIGNDEGLSADGSTFEGPSEIDAQPVSGGSAQTIYKSQTQAILYTRLASDHTLLFIAENEAVDNSTFGPAAKQPASVKDNGLWAVNMDGSGLHRLVELPAGDRMEFNLRVYTPWSTVSRDGTLYAVSKFDRKKNETDLITGSLDGKLQTTIGTTSAATAGSMPSGDISVIGWTTL